MAPFSLIIRPMRSKSKNLQPEFVRRMDDEQSRLKFNRSFLRTAAIRNRYQNYFLIACNCAFSWYVKYLNEKWKIINSCKIWSCRKENKNVCDLWILRNRNKRKSNCVFSMWKNNRKNVCSCCRWMQICLLRLRKRISYRNEILLRVRQQSWRKARWNGWWLHLQRLVASKGWKWMQWENHWSRWIYENRRFKLSFRRRCRNGCSLCRLGCS